MRLDVMHIKGEQSIKNSLKCNLRKKKKGFLIMGLSDKCALLTDAHWEKSRPAVVLLADSHRGADQLESWVALVDDCVSIAKVLPDHLSINNLLRETAVTRCGRTEGEKKNMNRVDVNMFY